MEESGAKKNLSSLRRLMIIIYDIYWIDFYMPPCRFYEMLLCLTYCAIHSVIIEQPLTNMHTALYWIEDCCQIVVIKK